MRRCSAPSPRLLRYPHPTCERGALNGRCVGDVAGSRELPRRLAGGQADLRRPLAERQPEMPRLREGAGADRRDRDHARARRPRRRDGRAEQAVQAGGRRRERRAEGLARAAGRGDGRPARPEQGRHGRGRRDQVHARERLPLERLRTRATTSARRRPRARARERHDALLRGRHLRLRRHAADRADLLARRGSAADRRPLHDGPARGRRRARAARVEALHPVPLRHLSRAHRDAGRAAQGSAAGVEVIELQPGETTTV